MTGAEIQHVSDGISLTRFNLCPEQMSAPNLYYVWGGKYYGQTDCTREVCQDCVASMHIHIEMDQVLCWTWMLVTQPDTEDDVVVPAMYSWGNWTWFNTYVHIHSAAQNIMYEFLPTPVRRVIESSNMTENTYLGHWYKNFNFDFFLCRKMWVLAGFLRCMPPTRKFVNNLQKWNIITKIARDIMTWEIMTT